MDDYKVLNEILVRLFRSIMDVEEKAIITQEFQDITNNDMHVIEAIGMGTPKNMSSIAKELSVTVGTLTIAMNSLVKKGYVISYRDGRESFQSATMPFEAHIAQCMNDFCELWSDGNKNKMMKCIRNT